jgi:ubiquinone/menaquinone biosynthesis C-methylase UbiE
VNHNEWANLKDKNLIMENLSDFVGSGSKILDVGFGTGKFTHQVKKWFKLRKIWGIDIEESKDKGIISEVWDLNRVPYPYSDNSFDVVLSVQNIEHLYFTDDYLNELRRILKKDGYLVLTTTNLAGLHYRLMLLLGFEPSCLHPSEFQVSPLKGRNPRWGHKSVFTFDALKYVLEMHSFEIVKAYSHSLYFLPDFLCKLFPNWGTFSCFICRRLR